VIALHPGIVGDYRRNVAALQELLNAGGEDEQYDARQRLRSLIEKVVVSPAEGRPGTAISLEGRLAALLDLAAGRAATQDHVCQRWCPGGDSNATYVA
jgi:site-specific DNA recombinase